MQISAAKFKTNCLGLMDDVRRTRKPVLITKRGRPVARLMPVEDTVTKSLHGYLKGSVTVKEDIVAPIDEEWDAER